MFSPPRTPVLAALTACLVLPILAATAADGSTAEPRPPAGGSSQRHDVTAAVDTAPIDARGTTWHVSQRIEGSDGLLYNSSPVVVPGLDDDLYFGLEFDLTCAYADRFDAGLKRLAKLAQTIENSGRKVVFTVAPNKTSVDTGNLQPAILPQGACDSFAMAHQDQVLDSYQNPHYLPLRQPLLHQPGQTYWLTDPHWTSVGGSVYARSLAGQLSRRLGRHQHFVAAQQTEIGLLNELRDVETPETAPAALPGDAVTVTTAPGSQDWPGFPYLIFDHAWDSSPASKTWPGQTLLIGDSFTQYALANLRPLFEHGRFLWTGSVDPQTMIDAIVNAKTVVIEVYQLAVPTSILGESSFRHQVKAALRH